MHLYIVKIKDIVVGSMSWRWEHEHGSMNLCSTVVSDLTLLVDLVANHSVAQFPNF